MARSPADLLALQGKIKRDPEGYVDEYRMLHRHFQASLEIFLLKPSNESREFGDLVTFLAQVAGCYPNEAVAFSKELITLLDTHAAVLEPALLHTLTRALILLRNRGQVGAMEVLPLFFRLFRCRSKALRGLLFRHIVADIKAGNQRARNDKLNRALQNFLYSVLAEENEAAAKKSLAVLAELWRRQIWRDARTVNVIASAAMHQSPRIMLAAVKFFLGQDAEEDEESDEEEAATPAVAGPSRSEIYNAKHKGTVSSKKKKEKKLKRVMASLKKAAQKEKGGRQEGFAAIQLLHDPQDFAEKLLARVQKGGAAGARFETRLALLNCVSRVVGVHRLLLLPLYPFLQKYIQPHQRDVTHILAALVQACHELVPPEALAPVLRQLVDQFVSDRSRPEVMTIGIKTVREMCLRTPLIMTPELLQDLAMYKKYREKQVATAARSLIGLFRELAPAMLEKKDRGRGADLGAVPLQYGAQVLQDRVEGAELLERAEREGELGESSDEGSMEDDGEESEDEEVGSEREEAEDSGEEVDDGEVAEESEEDGEDAEELEEDGKDAEEVDKDGEAGEEADERAQAAVDETAAGCEAEKMDVDLQRCREESNPAASARQPGAVDTASAEPPGPAPTSLSGLKKALQKAKRKRAQSAEPRSSNGAETRAVQDEALPIEQGRILTEEDFERIKELRHKRLVEAAMAKHGLKSASKRARLQALAEDEAEEILRHQDQRATAAERSVAPEALVGKHKKRKDKQERLSSVMEGRADREFGAAAGMRKKKTGGSSNKQKARQKALPSAARAHQIRKRGLGKPGKHRNQFRGTKGRGYARR